MAVVGSGKAAGATTGVVIGGACCLGLILFAIAGTIILSLISVYTPNISVEGYGEEYRINTLLLKSLYQSTSNRFVNGIIAPNTQLSALCAMALKNSGRQNIAGCILDNQRGFGPFNSSVNSRRRRRQSESGLYSTSQARIFYSTPCSKKSDQGKYMKDADLSSCVARRLMECNELFNNSETTFTEWPPVPSEFSYSIVDERSNAYAMIAVLRVFGVQTSTAHLIAESLGLSTTIHNELSLGCQYIGKLPKAAIAAAIAAQAPETVTQPTSPQPMG